MPFVQLVTPAAVTPPPTAASAQMAVVPAAPTPDPAVKPAEPPRSRARAGWLAGLLLGWRRVGPRNALEQPTRAALLAHVRAHPGDHLRGAARALGLAPQNVEHHLRHLARLGIVTRARMGRRSYYFPSEGGRPMQERARDALAASGRARGAVLAAIRDAPGIHQADIARRSGLLDATVSWSVRHLLRGGLVAEHRVGHRRGYVPTERGLEAASALDTAR